MARQVGPVKIIGTVDECTFYKMMGEYYVRMKSSLTAKRFWQDKAFEGSRRSCERMKQASPFASWLYSYYPKEKKSRELWWEVVGGVLKMIKAGWEREVIQNWFYLEYLGGEDPEPDIVEKAPIQRKRPLRRRREKAPRLEKRLPRFIYEELPDRKGELAGELREAYEGRAKRSVARESLWIPVVQKAKATLFEGQFANKELLLRA